jgi:PAS domain-containing protein
MLSQVMVKDALILISSKLPEATETGFRNALKSNIDSFIDNNKLLLAEVGLPNIPVSLNTLEIKRLLTNSQTHFKSMMAVATEVAQADKKLIEMNAALYTRELLLNEKKYSQLMGDIKERYLKIIEGKNEDAAAINTTKFISLVIALLCLVLLVIEPLFRSGRKNHDALINSEQKFRLLAEHSEDMITVTNFDGNLQYISPSVSTHFGIYTR